MNIIESEEDFHTCMHTWQAFMQEGGDPSQVSEIVKDSDGFFEILFDGDGSFHFYNWLLPQLPADVGNTPAQAMLAYNPERSRGAKPITPVFPPVNSILEPERVSIKPVPSPPVQSPLPAETPSVIDLPEEGATGFLNTTSELTLVELSTNERFQFAEGTHVLGRSSLSSSVSLSKDITVSRRHCKLEFRNSEVTVADLNSSNGTWLGSTRLTPNTPYKVRPGNLLRLGGVVFSVEF